MRPASASGLYWSIRGQVACAEQAPQMDDPQWGADNWAPVPVSAGHIHGYRYQCQHCAIDGRPVRHQIEPPN
jgi:hypothetical protein